MTVDAPPVAPTPEPEPKKTRSFGVLDVVAIALLPVLVGLSVLVFAVGNDPADDPAEPICWSQTVAQSEIATLNEELELANGQCLSRDPEISELIPERPQFTLRLTYESLSAEVQDNVTLRIALPPGFEPLGTPVMVQITTPDPAPAFEADDSIWDTGIDVGPLPRGAGFSVDAAIKVTDTTPRNVDEEEGEAIYPIRLVAGPTGQNPLGDTIQIIWVPEEEPED